MFSQQNNFYCDLLSETKIKYKIEASNTYDKKYSRA